MVVAFGSKRSPFAKKNIVSLKDFSLGLNNQVSAYLIDDKELADVQNFHYDERGTLTKRMGYAARYGSAFATNAVRGLYNFRLSNGTSFLLAAADDKVFYEAQSFQANYDTKADWDTGTLDAVSSATTPGDIVLEITLANLAEIQLAAESAILGGSLSSRSGTWTSPAIDISAVVDKTTGIITDVATLPAGTTRVIQTRTATTVDMVTGVTAWVGLGAGNTIVSAGNNYFQFRALLTSTDPITNPSVSSMLVTYDAAASMTSLITGLDQTARYDFETMNDIVYILNGVDSNREWSGTGAAAVAGGSPPFGKYVQVHKNRMFIAGVASLRSRLYYSDLADAETWPVLNFIDVGKGDGDTITGLTVLLDTLVIYKTNSVWMLTGSSSSDFVLRRVTDEAGSSSNKSLSLVKNSLIGIATDGVRLFDGIKSITASDKIEVTFEGLNRTQLALAEGVTFDHHYYLAVPEGSSIYNNVVLVYDLIRAAWTVYRGMNVGAWCIWRRYNKDYLLFGSATTGQVYQYPSTYSDAGVAIDAFAVTKQMFGGDQETVHLLRLGYVDCRELNDAVPTTLELRLRANNGSDSSPTSLTVSAGLNVKRFIPAVISVTTVRTVGVKVRNNEAGRQLAVYGIVLEWAPRGRRET